MSTTSVSAPSRRRKIEKRGLYLRVRDQILLQIATAEIPVGETFSTEEALAKELRVSRNTVRKALAALEDEGYISRRRGLGMILEKRPPVSMPADVSAAATGSGRLQVIVQLPFWNDSVEGFYTGRLLKALARPSLDPPLAMEVRHHDDAVTYAGTAGRPLITIDPDPLRLAELHALHQGGTRVLVVEPCQPMGDMLMLCTDTYGAIRDAVHRLYRLGHKAVGLINHQQTHWSFRQSCSAYIDAHRELAKPIHPNAFVQFADEAIEPHHVDVRNVTAWICSYIGAVNIVATACHQAGLRIPEDVSIVSKDDTGDAPMAGVGKAVSCISYDAEAAADMIHACLKDSRRDGDQPMVRLPYRWIDRQTIAAPSS